MKINKAAFGMGCFWKAQAVFEQLEGVRKTTVGFMGGYIENPTYEQVKTGKTNHVEVVQLEYDPIQISYLKLLEIFWKNHDPTTFNRQGADIGPQYKSVIFYYGQEQEEFAWESKEKMQKHYDKKIVTEILPAKRFYPAEKEHQKYSKKHNL